MGMRIPLNTDAIATFYKDEGTIKCYVTGENAFGAGTFAPHQLTEALEIYVATQGDQE